MATTDSEKHGFQAEVTSGRDEGFSGTVTAMNIMFGLDHITITAIDGSVRQVPIEIATRVS